MNEPLEEDTQATCIYAMLPEWIDGVKWRDMMRNRILNPFVILLDYQKSWLEKQEAVCQVEDRISL